MHESIVLTLAGIGLLALACQWLAWWLKLPAILFLLLSGLVAGPVTGLLDPDALFGDLLFPFVSLSVAVILFEGSLTLRFDEIRGLEAVVRRLVTSGVLVTWGVIAGATFLLMDFPLELAVLFGAMVTVTGPTVIVPMLRTVRPTAGVANVLRWEGIVIDPIGALLAVLVFEFIIAGQSGDAFGHTLWIFGQMLLSGLVLGAAAGYGLGQVLRRHWLPDYLHDVATLLLVFAVFAAANAVVEESGLLAVTVMGMWLANMRDVRVDDILDFKESLSIMLISGLFILLAARLDFADLQALGWEAVGVLLVVQLVARPLKVAVSTLGSQLTMPERALLGWIAPRGIVAAAVAALFALRLTEAGYPEAELLVPLTFLVIVGTVVVQSATARLFAQWLGVAEPEPKGFLLVGAHELARRLGKALKDEGFSVLLADTNWEHIRAARMEGLPTYFGNVVSRHADRNLSLIGIGRLLALSPRRELNALAALRYRAEFGAQNIYSLPTPAEKDDEGAGIRTLTPVVGQIAFQRDATYAHLASALSQGAGIRATRLSESFTFTDYCAAYEGKAVPLVAIDPAGRARIFNPEPAFKPVQGWVILGLVPQEEKSPEARAEKREARKNQRAEKARQDGGEGKLPGESPPAPEQS